MVPRNVNLITGVGYGGYGEVAPDVDVVGVSATAVSSSLTVDNAWLKLLLEEGLIGVLLFAAVMVAGVRSALAVMRRLDARVPAIIASSTLLLLVFQGISVDSFDINPWNAFLWLTLALSYPEPRLPRAASAPGAGVQETSAAAGGPFGDRVSHRAETA